MISTTQTQLKRYLAYMVLCCVALFAFGQTVSAHGGGEEEEASENLVEMLPATGENYHIEIEVETLDGNRIPELSITAVITNIETGEKTEKMLHGMFGGNYHYGSNVALPKGEYAIAFHIDPPTFMREGSRAGSWVEPVDAKVTFTSVETPEEEFETEILRTEDMVVVFVAEPAQAMWAFPGAMMDMHGDTEGDMHDEMDGMMDDHDMGSTDHDDEEESSGAVVVGVLTLVLGAVAGFLFGKSRKSPQVVTAPENTDMQG